MDTIKQLLNQEIESELKTLGDMEMGSEEQSKATNDLAKLLDKSIELEKIRLDNKQKFEKQNLEFELKEKELDIKKEELKIKETELENQKLETDLKRKQVIDERIDKIVKNVLTAVSIVGGFTLTVWGTKKSFEFENTGSITTIMGRGFINKLLHKN